MMFLHARVHDRFTFSLHDEESVAGISARRISYREVARPTLTKTTRGRATAAYSNVRKFQVATDAKLGKPPGAVQ